MSKRMGLLKTLRTGGGSGAGPLAAGGCFLREKLQRWQEEPLLGFPHLCHGLGGAQPPGTGPWGHL